MVDEINIMDWDICLEKYIRNVEKDNEKVESIKETVEKRIKYLDSIDVNKDNISFIVEGFYEVIKELLTALLLSKGLRSRNHQCLISYFYKNYPEYEENVNLISRMGYLRNRLDYYGELIDYEFYKKHRNDFKELINILKKLIEK
jgi:uncharacterized protein (UPF0332 family)